MVFGVHLPPELHELLRAPVQLRFGVEAVDRPALEGAVRRERHGELHADLVREVEPEHEVGEQGEIAGVRRQGVFPGRPAGDVDRAPETARLVHGVVVGERLLGGRRVHELDVVGLDEVLQDELPVGGDLAEVDGGDVVDPGEVDPLEPAPERGGELLERRRRAVQVDEDPVAPRRRPHRNEPVPPAVEAGRRRAGLAPAEVGGEVERAVEPVGPGVVGAPDRPPGVSGGVHELEVPMAAHVVEGPDPESRVAHEEERAPRHGDRGHVAGAGELVREAREDPCAGEDPLVLEREERLARVRRPRKPGMRRAPGLERGEVLGPQDGSQRFVHASLPRAPAALRHAALEQEPALEHADPACTEPREPGQQDSRSVFPSGIELRIHHQPRARGSAGSTPGAKGRRRS